VHGGIVSQGGIWDVAINNKGNLLYEFNHLQFSTMKTLIDNHIEYASMAQQIPKFISLISSLVMLLILLQMLLQLQVQSKSFKNKYSSGNFFWFQMDHII
jgi:hypothetical protein